MMNEPAPARNRSSLACHLAGDVHGPPGTDSCSLGPDEWRTNVVRLWPQTIGDGCHATGNLQWFEVRAFRRGVTFTLTLESHGFGQRARAAIAGTAPRRPFTRRCNNTCKGRRLRAVAVEHWPTFTDFRRSALSTFCASLPERQRPSRSWRRGESSPPLRSHSTGPWATLRSRRTPLC